MAASDGPQLTSSEKLRELDGFVVHFPGYGDFVFVRNPWSSGEFTVHTIFVGVSFGEVLRLCRLAARRMAHEGMDALASYCPKMNRGAQALCRAMGMTPVHEAPHGAVWGGLLADLLGKDKELVERVDNYATGPMPRNQRNALAAALFLLGDNTSSPATPWRRDLLRRIVFMLSETGPVAQVPVNGQQHLLFGEAGVIIPVGPLS